MDKQVLDVPVQITFDQFQAVDIRIGMVTEAVVPEWSHWVMKIKVNLGSEIGEKICFSGIMKFFKPEDLRGKQFPFVVNLKPRMIGPDKELSEVMMIMAVPSESEDVAPVLFQLQERVSKAWPAKALVENGTKVR